MDVPEIGIEEFAAIHGPDTVLIDVREPDEYAEAHVEGAQLIPLGELAARAGEVPAADQVYVICAVGGRSRKAAEHLRARGVDAINIDGGTKGWVGSGRPYLTGP